MRTYTQVNATQDFYAVSFFDGHGRVQAQVSDHPGSVGGYRTVYNAWDQMGRLEFTTPPTESDVSWNPTGDDAAGYPQIFQNYDWKGRPTITTNADFTTKTIAYGGCGCAGGEVVTTTDEVGRQQRITRDVYPNGLTLDSTTQVDKVEILNPGGTTTYSTTATVYKSNERKTYVRQYDGATTNYLSCPTGTCQESWTQSDGHGRPLSRHRSIETGASSYQYFPDDSVQRMTDPRGAYADYSYNKRGLATNIGYTAPANATPSIIATGPVTFEYDSVGNRIKMTDGLGYQDYHYDTLSRMDWEKRHFNDLANDYQLSYEYNLRNQLTKLTDPWNASVGYVRDNAGRVTSVTGAGYGNFDSNNSQAITQFASGIKYSAWDGMKELNNGNVAAKAHFAMAYDARLRLTRYESAGRVTEHDYYDDNRVQEVRDLAYTNFNRSYSYDQAGRLATASAGSVVTKPYNYTYSYNTWDSTTSRTGTHWTQDVNFNATYTNDRNLAMTYDNAGNVTGDLNNSYPQMRYDSAGREVSYRHRPSGFLTDQVKYYNYDGDGEQIRRTFVLEALPPYTTVPQTSNVSNIRSSVLRETVATIGSSDYFNEKPASTRIYGSPRIQVVSPISCSSQTKQTIAF